jgi:sterol desaturase/sphingolipid hydroxylase (fatty acid hydroxylase superfamily)
MDIHHYLMFFLPVFAVMIAVEFWIGRKRGLTLYTRDESIASVVIAVGQRLISLIPLNFLAAIWFVTYDNRVIEVSANGWWYIPALFIGVEFCYYWFHRLSHDVRWMWATHSVHHSTEEMNVLAAYRFGWTEEISLAGVAYTPLLLIGFHPAHVMAMLAVTLVYQTWLHTDLIGKLGPLEGVVNTPSAHRVHHARNADYLDRNLGGVLMIWDRMFGTYEEERDDVPVEYGLIKPSGSANSVRIAFHEWGNMINDLKKYSIRHWPMLLFGPPGWAPNGEGQTSAQLRDAYRAGRALNEPANANAEPA